MSAHMKKHHTRGKSLEKTGVSTKKRASKTYKASQCTQAEFSKLRITHPISRQEQYFNLPSELASDVLSLIGGYKEENTVEWRRSFSKEIKEVGEPALALRGARIKEGMTQKELADYLGASQAYVSQLENGRKEINKSTAQILEKILNINYKVFL